jgi:hypothetical protein
MPMSLNEADQFAAGNVNDPEVQHVPVLGQRLRVSLDPPTGRFGRGGGPALEPSALFVVFASKMGLDVG